MISSRFTHPLCLGVAAMTVLLLFAGALVTSTGSGLAVPDWPLSFGTLMPPMVGGVFYEHGHRMIAGTVAILTLIQAVWISRSETRRWVKVLGFVALAVVITQAILGGMTVIFRLPPQISIAHATLAQTYFSIAVVLVVVTSGAWDRVLVEGRSALGALPRVCLLMSFCFVLQLLLGATMRHTGAGLIIPDFPTVYGGFYPTEANFRVWVHYLHRVFALVLLVGNGYLVYRFNKVARDRLTLVAISGAVLTLILVQGTLGAMVVWMRRPIPLTSLHLVVGALCLAGSIALTCLAFRANRAKESA